MLNINLTNRITVSLLEWMEQRNEMNKEIRMKMKWMNEYNNNWTTRRTERTNIEERTEHNIECCHKHDKPYPEWEQRKCTTITEHRNHEEQLPK